MKTEYAASQIPRMPSLPSPLPRRSGAREHLRGNALWSDKAGCRNGAGVKAKAVKSGQHSGGLDKPPIYKGEVYPKTKEERLMGKMLIHVDEVAQLLEVSKPYASSNFSMIVSKFLSIHAI